MGILRPEAPDLDMRPILVISGKERDGRETEAGSRQ